MHQRRRSPLNLWTMIAALGLGACVIFFLLSPPTPEQGLVHSLAYRKKMRTHLPILNNAAQDIRFENLKANRTSSVVANLKTAQDSERIPASVNTEAPDSISLRSRRRSPTPNEFNARNLSRDFAIPCGRGRAPSRASFDRGVSQVRLTGSTCRPDNAPELIETEIKNSTNGASATVFMTSATVFTTDYLALNFGENQLQIRQRFKDGSEQKTELVLTRVISK